MSSLAIFLPCLYGGGVERVLVNLMRGFVEQGLVEQGLKIDLVLAFVEGSLPVSGTARGANRRPGM
jgi:hypothetical protein